MINYFTSIALLADKIARERDKNEAPIVRQILIYNSDKDKNFLEIYKEHQHIRYFQKLQEFISEFCESINIIRFNPKFDADNPDNFVKLIHNIEIYKNNNITDMDFISDTLERLEKNIPENDDHDLHMAFINWFKSGIFDNKKIIKLIAESKNIQEAGKIMRDEFETWETRANRKVFTEGMMRGINSGWEKGIERGFKQGIEKGIEQGIVQGMKKGREEGEKNAIISSILKVLEARFSFVPDNLKKIIMDVPGKSLDNLLTNAAIASSIDDFCQESEIGAGHIHLGADLNS